MKIYGILIILLFVLSVNLIAENFVVIVNKANSASSISSADLQNIYSGKKSTWADGKSIVASFNNGSAKDDFLKDGIKKTLPQYQTFWKKAVFTGTGTPPKELDSDAKVKEFVSSNPNAVGFISASALDASVKKLDIK